MKVGARGVLVVAALTLGACSGESAAPATSVTAEATTEPTAPPATEAAPTTTTIATTSPPVTTAPTTSSATTIPPTTTTATIPADLAQAQQDVIDATIAAWRAYQDASRDPSNEAKLATLAATVSGPKLELSVRNIASLVASGLTAVENPTTPAAVDIYEDTVLVDPVAGTASVELCRIGSDLGIQVGGNPDGTDTIVVNEVNAYHERSELVFVDGRWLDNGGEVLQKYPGTTTCG